MTLQGGSNRTVTLNTDGLHEQLEGARFDVVVLDTRLPAPVSLEYIAGLRKKLNGAAPDPAPGDLGRGLALYRRAMAAMLVALAGLALL